VLNVAVRDYSNAQYEPFPPLLYPTPRAMLRGRNDDLIRAPIITENDGLFISRWYAIPEYSGGVFAAIAAGGGDDFSVLSIHGNPDPNFVFATKDKGLQLIPIQHRNLFGINRL